MDPKMVGREYPPIAYEAGKEKWREYARAVGDLNPKYVGGTMAPPMFAVVFAKEIVGKMVMDPELGLDLPMLVHGEQEFEFKEPVRSGDVLSTGGRVAEAFTKERPGKPAIDFVVFETVSRNQQGREVCRGRWTMAIRRTD